MQDLYIAEIYRPGKWDYLVAAGRRVYLHSLLHSKLRKKATEVKMVRYGRSSSSNLVPIESPYMIS